MNQPSRHHFIPRFYLSRWASRETTQLVEFSRPFGAQVKPRRTHPNGTGYVDRLYALKGLSDDLAQQVEELFFKPVDGLAATTMAKLELGETELPNKLRYAWARFLLSLALRTPTDVDGLQSAYRNEWKHHLKHRIAEETGHNVSGLSAELVDGKYRNWFDNNALDLLASLIDDEKLIAPITRLHWFTINTECETPFFTGDRPLVMTTTLFETDAYIIFPIGPHRLFCAVESPSTLVRMIRRGHSCLVKTINKIIVRQCERYVYGLDDRSLAFVQKHFGAQPKSSLIQRVVNYRAELARTN